MSAESTLPSSQMSMFSTEDSPAKMSAWRDAARDWLASGQDSSTSSSGLRLHSALVGSSLRTSPAFFRRTTEGTWEPSSERWRTSGMGGPTESLTLNTSASPNDAIAVPVMRWIAERIMLVERSES